MELVPRPTLYDDRLRERLITSAAAALATGGPSALSLRTVAEAAGTSTNAVYTLFGGKDGLVQAAVSAASAGFTAAQRAVGRSDDAAADLFALGRAYRGWALSNPELYAVMFGGRISLPPRPDPSAEGAAVPGTSDAIDPLVSTVLRLIDDGTFVGDPEEIVQTIWASVHGMVTLELALWLDRPRPDRDRGYDAQLHAVQRAWRSEPASEASGR